MSKHKQPHRRWDNEVLESLACEHNALFHDWQDAKKELDRIGKVNGDLCDENFELKKAQTTTAPGTVTVWTCSTTEMEQAWIKSGNKIKGEWMFAMDYLRDKAIVAAPLGPEGRTAEQWYEYARNADKMLCRERKKVQFLQDKLDRLPVAAPAPVPAGVPSAEELEEIYRRAFCGCAISGERTMTGITAIRDAVLAGVQGEMQALRERAEKAVKAMGDQAEFWRLLNDAKIDGMVPTTNLCSAAGQLINLALASSPAQNPVAAPATVDPDAWKTTLEHGDGISQGKYMTRLSADDNMWSFSVRREAKGETYWDGPEKAREWAMWLASYAAAHGCPVELPVTQPDPDPVASPATIEALTDVLYGALTYKGQWRWGVPFKSGRDGMKAAVTAILRAAKPTIDVTPGWHRHGTYHSFGLSADNLDWLNSRIRWTMPKPEPIHPIYAEPKINCHGCGVTLPASALEKGYNPIVDGVRVAVCGRCWENKVDLPRRTYTAADVEALAKVLHESPDILGDIHSWDGASDIMRDAYRNEARASIAWFGGRVEG